MSTIKTGQPNKTDTANLLAKNKQPTAYGSKVEKNQLLTVMKQAYPWINTIAWWTLLGDCVANGGHPSHPFCQIWCSIYGSFSTIYATLEVYDRCHNQKKQ